MRNVSLTTNKAKQNKKLDSGATNTVKSNTQTNNNSTTTTTKSRARQRKTQTKQKLLGFLVDMIC